MRYHDHLLQPIICSANICPQVFSCDLTAMQYTMFYDIIEIYSS